MKQAKIAIVGAGVVGSATAYTLIMQNLASSLILVDINDIKCKGEVLDLSDAASFFTPADIEIGTLQDAGQADIAIITSGVPQKPGQSRIDLLHTNYEIIKNVIHGMKPLNPALIIIIVANPVDILTHLAQQIAGLPTNQVFGSGTLLDTQRLCYSISRTFNIAQESIHLYVLGEHGDSQFPVWSSATIAGVPLVDFPDIDQQELDKLADTAKHRAYDIIACKGSTAFGIAACIATYCKAIMLDTKMVMPVSCYREEFDICLSMPAVMGRHGIEQVLVPALNDEEKHKLQESAALLKHHMQQLT